MNLFLAVCHRVVYLEKGFYTSYTRVKLMYLSEPNPVLISIVIALSFRGERSSTALDPNGTLVVIKIWTD